ncbi:tRNA (uridine(54)-C5)-methyltransferase TrmA [Tolumonas lignilytica]|uniref:tRNA (uridine(54)-C5)-methyltransferase TrmA n=1 Tax=Tolumonas lignilytica TaxID=1283284 RepID=UPI00046370B5|nr:tRNA (uridine(54)-C5)-methyltransferase TrmA [Tolumonas lignilytica]
MTHAAHSDALYQQQLHEKQQRLTQLLAPFQAPMPDVFASAPTHYRMRAEFRIWHEGDELFYVMFNSETKQRYYVQSFPTGSFLINQLMPRLQALLQASHTLKHKLFQVDFLTTLSGEALISLLYHKTLNDEWQPAARELRQTLRNEFGEIDIVGRAHKQKIVLEREYVLERLQVGEQTLEYMQVENSFTQPNAEMNQHMLGWALDVTAGCQGDLLELYCGNGNFSLALAKNFNRVLATEIAKSSVNAAQHNIAVNQIDNVQILHMSAEEFTQAMNGVREFNRLKGIDLHSYQCNTILVDPPRAGLDPATLAMIQEYEQILYISCNPQTLCDNLNTLCQTHAIKRCALFDQFPFTHHMESGVWLVRK